MLSDFTTNITQRLEGIGFGTEADSDKDECFKKARYFSRRNDFVKEIIRLRLGIYNFGFRLLPADGGKAAKKKLNDWWTDRKNARVRQKIDRYARDAWREWFVSENLVSLWRKDSAQPTILSPENVVKFRDDFGIEVLTIRHNLSDKEIDEMPELSRDTRLRLKQSKTIKITHDDDLFRFEVSKLAKAGEGLGWPGLLSILLRCGQFEALEVRENILANATRRVIEQHKMGHETRYGLQSGTNVNFITPKRVKAAKEELQGKVGHIQLATNFDHTMDWPGPDPKHFDGKKYQAIYDRLVWWAMPLGHMIVAKAFNPNLMQILEFMALQERDLLRPHLEFVLNDIWGPGGRVELPVPVSIGWDNKVLKDARFLMQLVQNGLNAGPVSQQTYRETAAIDNDEEMARKEAEAGLDKKITQPIYDAAHGPPNKKTNGKPAGGKDKS